MRFACAAVALVCSAFDGTSSSSSVVVDSYAIAVFSCSLIHSESPLLLSVSLSLPSAPLSLSLSTILWACGLRFFALICAYICSCMAFVFCVPAIRTFYGRRLTNQLNIKLHILLFALLCFHFQRRRCVRTMSIEHGTDSIYIYSIYCIGTYNLPRTGSSMLVQFIYSAFIMVYYFTCTLGTAGAAIKSNYK